MSTCGSCHRDEIECVYIMVQVGQRKHYIMAHAPTTSLRKHTSSSTRKCACDLHLCHLSGRLCRFCNAKSQRLDLAPGVASAALLRGRLPGNAQRAKGLRWQGSAQDKRASGLEPRVRGRWERQATTHFTWLLHLMLDYHIQVGWRWSTCKWAMH